MSIRMALRAGVKANDAGRCPAEQVLMQSDV